jgi:hypothetical protein
MTLNFAGKRALAAAMLALGALGSLAVADAQATPSIPIPPPSPGETRSGSQSSAIESFNDIKIGNRSQFIQSGWYDIVGPGVG